jgi:hypothetical protein
MNLEEHWNSIFNKTDDNKLGWWENETSQTLKFIENININSSTNIFLAGAGTSVLVDELIKKDCNLVLNDISFVALEKLKSRLRDNLKLDFFQYDLSKPFIKDSIDLWIDRAVLHFLLEEKDIENYFENLNKNTKKDSLVFFAEFKKGGAKSCASLEIKQYDVHELSKRLGKKFELILSEDYDFINPFGNKKEYIYALFRKIKS